MSQHPNQRDLTAQMISLLRGNWITQMLYVAAELKLADHLACDEVGYDELATKCRVDRASLYRLLRGLASIGIFEEKSSGVFTTTSLADLLRTSRPDSLYSMALMQGQERYSAWGSLLECIKSGENAFTKKFDHPVFEWYRSHPKEATVFDNAMAAFTASEIEALLKIFSFERFRHLVDVAGGNGRALKQILQHSPHLQGTLVELPNVLDSFIAPPDLQSRLKTVASDIFNAVPSGGDVYLLKNVLHDWGDKACLTILRNIRSAMAGCSATLLIFEQIIPTGNLPFPGKLLDLNMLVVHEEGRERSFKEYKSLIQKSGLAICCVKSTSSPLSIIEAEISKPA